MKILVGYNGSEAAKRALELAKDYATTHGASVFVMTSMEGGAKEKMKAISTVADHLEDARSYMERAGVPCEISQLVRGLSPGEDLVQFARENRIDHIFLGIEKLSRLGKLLLGSTAQYIILKAPCPVTTVKP